MDSLEGADFFSKSCENVEMMDFNWKQKQNALGLRTKYLKRRIYSTKFNVGSIKTCRKSLQAGLARHGRHKLASWAG